MYHAWRKFTEIYVNPRAGTARALCIDFLAAKSTVLVFWIASFLQVLSIVLVFGPGPRETRSTAVLLVRSSHATKFSITTRVVDLHDNKGSRDFGKVISGVRV